jgi:hypothetical protein
MTNGLPSPPLRSSDLMVVTTVPPPLTMQQELCNYFTYLARQAHDPGDIRSGTPWPSGSNNAPFLSPQGLDQGGFVWPNSAGI